MTLDQLSFQLELQDSNCLVHLHVERQVAHVISFGIVLDLEAGAGIILVDIHGELHQRNQVDAVGILQNVQVAVAGGQTHNGCHAGQVAAGGTDPYNVVIAPLDIYGMVMNQCFDNLVRTGTAIIDIADDM